MKRILPILVIVLILTSLIIFTSNSSMSVLLTLDRTEDANILTIKDTKPGLLDEIKKKLKDLIFLIEHGDITHGLNDLSPMPEDVFECEDCNCSKTDYSLTKETKRLWQNVSDGEHKYLMDWQYTGWTVDEAESHDTDYSKFSDRTTVNQDKEYLFKWKINNYKTTTEGGNQRFTYEYRNSNYTPGNIKFDESTRNGSFVKAEDGTEWLDLGPNGLFEAQDGRIKCAFAPMVTAGQAALQNLIKAKGWFHRGDVWTGGDAQGFEGLALWQNFQIDCPKGSYIDVVFRENNSGKEVVIPFIFSDAKNIHNFGSAGQRVDQRYGQCRANIAKSGTNGFYEYKTEVFSCQVKRVANDLESYMTTHKGVTAFEVCTYEQLRQHLSNSDINSFFDGEDIYNISNKFVLEGRILLLNDNTIGEFTNWKTEEKVETVLKYSDDDSMVYTAHTALELIRLVTPASLGASGQDGNFYIAQVLLDGFYFDGNANRQAPDWSIKGMRAYKGKVVGDGEFTKRSSEMTKVSSISSSNRIIDFCGPDCKCNICIKVAK